MWRNIITLLTILMPNLLTSQISLNDLVEGSDSQRVVLSIFSETEWDAQIANSNLNIFAQGGRVEVLIHVPQGKSETSNIEIASVSGDPEEGFDFSCDCRILVDKFGKNFLIVDLLRRNLAASDSQEGFELGSQWWRDGATVSNHIYFPDSILESRSGGVRRELGLDDIETGLILEASMPVPYHALKSVNPTKSLENNIGVAVPHSNLDFEHKATSECPIRVLYENEEGGFRNPKSALFTEVRRELDHTQGERDTEQILNHVTYFLQIGLVPEAGQLLTLIDDANFRKKMLLNIFRILSGERDVTFGPLERETCSGLLDVWDFVIAASEHIDGASESQAVLQFKALSLKIQEKLFPQFVSSPLEPNSVAEVTQFMELMANGLHSVDGHLAKRINHSEALLVRANRYEPEVMLDIFDISDEFLANDLVALNEAVRAEHRGTDLWFDLTGAEISHDIGKNDISSAISKINLLISSDAPHPFVQPLMDDLLKAVVTRATPSDLMSLHLSEKMQSWPQSYEDEVVDQLAKLGISYLIDFDSEARQNPIVQPGYVVGTDQPMPTFASSEDLSPVQIQKTLRESEQFKQEILRIVLSE